MALSTRCLRFFTLTGDVMFMGVGLVTAALQLYLVVPLLALLSVPSWLLTPFFLPLLPTVVSVPVGFQAFRSTQERQRWNLIGMTCMQVVLVLSMIVLAGWQLALGLGARVHADMTTIMNQIPKEESLMSEREKASWHTIYHELTCCGASSIFQGTHTPLDTTMASSSGVTLPCEFLSQIRDMVLMQRGCTGPAVDRVRLTLRHGAGVCAGAAALQLLCATLSVFYAESLRRAEIESRKAEESPEDKPLRGTVIPNQRY